MRSKGIESMYATHRVKNSDNAAIGFLVNGEFYPDYAISGEIQGIGNLSLTDNFVEAERELPSIRYSDLNKKVYARLLEENPFRRDIQCALSEWKEDSQHVVLQLEGTRQVGKTTELLKFAYSSYEYIIYINMANDKYDFISVLKSPRMLSAMEAYCRRALLPEFVNNKSTVIIIDEIQNSKDAYNSIRDMDAVFACDIVVTGSYLGRVLGNREFFIPAGTIEAKQMHTLSFREFCGVYGKEEILDSISLYGESDGKEYAALEELYNLYTKIGGYPEVVKRYRQTKDIGICYEVIDKLLKTFRDESRNYFNSPRDVEIFESVYREALKVMCNEKKGTGSNIIETVTTLTKKHTDLLVNKNEIANAIMWLQYTGIICTCDLAENGDIRTIKSGRRLYFSDCGLVSYLAGKSALAESALTGLTTETFIFNELHRLFKVRHSQIKVRGDNVCFSVYNGYELDFVILSKDRVVYGIEAKTRGGEPNSLKVFIKKHLIDKGIVVKPTHGGRGDVFDTIPVYTVGCRFPY